MHREDIHRVLFSWGKMGKFARLFFAYFIISRNSNTHALMFKFSAACSLAFLLSYVLLLMASAPQGVGMFSPAGAQRCYFVGSFIHEHQKYLSLCFSCYETVMRCLLFTVRPSTCDAVTP